MMFLNTFTFSEGRVAGCGETEVACTSFLNLGSDIVAIHIVSSDRVRAQQKVDVSMDLVFVHWLPMNAS
jgi:hypothetical protein